MRFFKTLSGFFETTNNTKLEQERSQMGQDKGIVRDVVDEHLFVEALALTAFEISY